MELEERVRMIETDFAAHQASCDVRQGNILARLGRIEGGIIALLIGAVSTLMVVVGFLLTNKVAISMVAPG
jgi:hypothetical protein